MKRCRSRVKQTPFALRPSKLFRTVCYHTRYIALARKAYEGVHLGSGGLQIPGFLNVDADLFIDSDLTARSEHLKLAVNSVGCIYASHLFEHIHRQRVPGVLKNWFGVLQPGGKLFLCVPDLEALSRLYLETLTRQETPEDREKLDLIARVMYGGQTDSYDFHYFGYSFESLRSRLAAAGFTNIQRFDRAALSFAPFRDGGYAVISDLLVSLNVEATKPA